MLAGLLGIHAPKGNRWAHIFFGASGRIVFLSLLVNGSKGVSPVGGTLVLDAPDGILGK